MTREERFDAFVLELQSLTTTERGCSDFCERYVPEMSTWVKQGGERPSKPHP